MLDSVDNTGYFDCAWVRLCCISQSDQLGPGTVKNVALCFSWFISLLMCALYLTWAYRLLYHLKLQYSCLSIDLSSLIYSFFAMVFLIYTCNSFGEFAYVYSRDCRQRSYSLTQWTYQPWNAVMKVKCVVLEWWDKLLIFLGWTVPVPVWWPEGTEMYSIWWLQTGGMWLQDDN